MMHDVSTRGETHKKSRPVLSQDNSSQVISREKYLEGGSMLVKNDHSSNAEIREFLQDLTMREAPVTDSELQNAANLLQSIVNSPRPSVEVARRLDEIDCLIPALLDLNIRQARMDGRPDLAAGLSDLKANIELQKSLLGYKTNRLTEKIPAYEPVHENFRPEQDLITNIVPMQRFTGRVAVFQPHDTEPNGHNRIQLLKSALYAKGLLINADDGQPRQPDAAVFSNPFVDPALMEKMSSLSTEGVPLILDLDQSGGQSTLAALRQSSPDVTLQTLNKAYATALMLADLITVPSDSQAEKLRASGYMVLTIPNGWSVANPYWAAKAAHAGTPVRVGWFGSSGSLEDLALIRRPLIRLLREFEEGLRLVIVDDQDACQMFDEVSDSLTTFFPCAAHNDIPYLMDQMDILLLPARNGAVNHEFLENMLLYAGVKKIPWLATPQTEAAGWKRGGLICSNTEDWHVNLRQLIIEKDFRQSLGMEGFQAASRREMLIHIYQWYKAFHLVKISKPDYNIEA
jgi:hypothetical protein